MIKFNLNILRHLFRSKIIGQLSIDSFKFLAIAEYFIINNDLELRYKALSALHNLIRYADYKLKICDYVFVTQLSSAFIFKEDAIYDSEDMQ